MTIGQTNGAGANVSTLTLNNVQTNNAGTYAVIITNAAGSVTSSNVTLIVNVPPTIMTQPVSQTVSVGQNAWFTVAAAGTGPLGYQWSFCGTNLVGATNACLALTHVRMAQAGSYAVVVTNCAGAAASAATLIVTNPVITLAALGGTPTTPVGYTFQIAVPAGSPYVVLASATSKIGPRLPPIRR